MRHPSWSRRVQVPASVWRFRISSLVGMMTIEQLPLVAAYGKPTQPMLLNLFSLVTPSPYVLAACG